MSAPLLGLAPMAGLTDWPLRVLCYRMGAGYACTEMVSALGLMHAKPGNPTYRELLFVHPEETNTACQLFGSDPAAMGEAAARLTELGRFTMIDINMGCPARKVVSGGDGSALLRTPDLAARVMEAVKAHTTLPCTIKTRLGFDAHSMNALALCEAAQELGFRWAAIHGRTREQQYSGRADYEAIARIKGRLRMPVLANGDVFTPADAVRILRQTGADGVLIARGALGHPQLFRAAREALEGRAPTPETTRQRLDTALTHARWMADSKGERLGMLEMRKHIGHYISGVRGATAIRRELNALTSLAQLEELLARLLGELRKEEDTCLPNG